MEVYGIEQRINAFIGVSAGLIVVASALLAFSAKFKISKRTILVTFTMLSIILYSFMALILVGSHTITCILGDDARQIPIYDSTKSLLLIFSVLWTIIILVQFYRYRKHRNNPNLKIPKFDEDTKYNITAVLAIPVEADETVNPQE